MPLQTKELFENTTQIAEKQIRQARAEQSAFFWEMVRASARALIGKFRTNVVRSRLT